MRGDRLSLISPGLMLLDVVGSVLAGLGLAKVFANVDVVPEPLRFDGYGLAFIVLGFVLTLPAVFRVLRLARARGEAAKP